MEKSEITIQGKIYTAKFISLLTAEQLVFVEEKLSKARAKIAEDGGAEYKKVWFEQCSLMLNGDLSELDADKISPAEAKQLTDFFVGLLGMKTPS